MIDYDAAGEPPYVQVAGLIRDRIAAGYTGRLPAEKALSQELGVAIGTVRKATGLLKKEGLIYTIRGWGTFVSGTAP